ncbi:MAG TPA: class I SAM-dependent methyltransferase [Bradyrhizobium sp.]|nr:class I SAM-dependent methyltransferase [Bradyrhizobium sp.]
MPTETIGTQHQFGYEWAAYPEIVPLYKEQFRRWLGPFPLEGFKGKRFLDGGCGIGRNSFWALSEGAQSGIAIDYDDRTVAVARKNLATFPNCDVRFQSIYDFDEIAVVDVAFSIGVIHHLADPRKALERLVNAIVPGGTLIVWLYAREGNELFLSVIDPLRKLVTSRLPNFVTHWIAFCLTVLLKGYLALPHKRPYELLLRGHSFRQLEAIVLDQLIPSIAHYWTADEIRALISDLPLSNVTLTHTNKMSWTLTATRA